MAGPVLSESFWVFQCPGTGTELKTESKFWVETVLKLRLNARLWHAGELLEITSSLQTEIQRCRVKDRCTHKCWLELRCDVNTAYTCDDCATPGQRCLVQTEHFHVRLSKTNCQRTVDRRSKNTSNISSIYLKFSLFTSAGTMRYFSNWFWPDAQQQQQQQREQLNGSQCFLGQRTGELRRKADRYRKTLTKNKGRLIIL